MDKKVIDWLNPFSWFRVGLKVKNTKPDLLVIPWWMWGWAIPFFVIVALAKLNNKTKVIFLCHNVVEHETAFWKKVLTKLALFQADHYIVHSRVDEKNLRNMFSDVEITRTFHPIYEFFNQKKLSKPAARSKLKIEPKHEKIILFFGFVRFYKGLDILLKAMPKITEESPDLALIVAGEFWQDKDDYLELIKHLEIEDNLYLFDEYIPNEQVGNYFQAADLVVLPYRSATGSGITQIAFGFNKPVLATSVGDFPKVIQNGRRGAIIENNDSLAIADGITDIFKNHKLENFQESIEEDKRLFSWEGIVRKIELI